jgi:hypothetical protein
MNFVPNRSKSTLDKEIDRLISTMSSWQASEEEYATMVKNLEALIKLKTLEESTRRVSPDTVAIVTANLLGILLTLKYEELNVLTSKAMALIIKPKI